MPEDSCEERFSDLAVIATHYSERFEVEVDEICQQAFVKAHPRRFFQASLFVSCLPAFLIKQLSLLHCTLSRSLMIVSHIWQIHTILKWKWTKWTYSNITLTPSAFLRPGTFALNSHTYNPLFEKIVDPPLFIHSNRRYQIYICSVILGQLESFRNYQGLIIIFPQILDAI